MDSAVAEKIPLTGFLALYALADYLNDEFKRDQCGEHAKHLGDIEGDCLPELYPSMAGYFLTVQLHTQGVEN